MINKPAGYSTWGWSEQVNPNNAELQQVVEQFVNILVNWNSGAQPTVNWNSNAGPNVNWNSNANPIAQLSISLILDDKGRWHILELKEIGSLIQASEYLQKMLSDAMLNSQVGTNQP